MAVDTEELIQSQGWTYRTKGELFLVEVCPLCGKDKYHFAIYRKGNWTCKHCQDHGNIYELKQKLHIGSQIIKASTLVKAPIPNRMLNGASLAEYHEALLKNEAALNYLKGRGLTEETIRFFQIGYWKGRSPLDKKLKEYLIYPHCYHGQLVNVKYRSLPPAEKEFFSAFGCRKVMFNSDAIKDEKVAYLCEGEIDTMTLWQAGYKNAVGLTLGTGTLKPEWFDDLAHLQKIIIIQDADGAGRKGAETIAKRLGVQRCWNIKLPEGDDVNSFFLKHSLTDFAAIEPHLFPVKNICDFGSGISRLREWRKGGIEPGIAMPRELPSLKKILGTFANGDLVVVSGQPGVGKSTFVLQLASDVVLNQSGAALMYCLEMRPERLTLKTIQSYRGLREYEVTDSVLEEIGNELAEFELYYGFNYSNIQLEEVIETITEAVARYELDLVIFDNVHFLCTGKDTSAEVGRVTRSFKLLAENLEIPIVLLAHIRKLERGKEIPTLDDLKDSKSLSTDADTVIFLHRKSIDSNDGADIYENETSVKVAKRRYGPCSQEKIYYDGARSRFEELNKSHRS